MQLNQAAHELIVKIVYYGPGMAGKTTNLAHLQRSAAPGTASALSTIDTHSERTLHFDMLVTELGRIQGNHVRAEFHTVPGQSYYAATRRQLLVGADAVVFVADSRREALDENIASMNEMLDNLRQLELPSDIPVVVQYNKQDLPTAVRREQLDPLMNVRGWHSRGACATRGEGVSECAMDVLRMVAGNAEQVPLPESADAAPRSWLIACHRCQAMLEVPEATVGSIYTCGVCSSALEVVDPDRGLTREPQAGREPSPARSPQTLPPSRIDEPSDYAMKALPEPDAEASTSALQRSLSGTPAAGAPISSGGFPLAGFDVLGFLDENAQGRRVRVREITNGRTCRALVLSQALVSQPGYIDSIEPFVRLAGPLKHPHILPLLELRPAGDTVVLLSNDLPEHEPLGVVLGRRRALAPPHAMGLLRQVVLALEDAARQGVVHGWLRPECILVSPDGSVLVDEFAVPKNHRFLVRELAGASAATEYYLAPEHLGEDARSDLRSDMFLCGALLFRMITGEGLVTGYNAHEALHKLMAAGGKPLRAIGNSVSRDLDLFYRKLTALNRGERFESYRQLVEVLDRFGGGAKRQTLRLTQPVNAPSGRGTTGLDGGTRGHQRAATGSQSRTSTANNLRPATGSGTGPHRRSSAVDHPHPPPKRGGGAVMALIIIIAFLALVGAVAYLVMQQQQRTAASASASQPALAARPTATPPAAVTPPAAATPPPAKFVSPNQIGAVPPSTQTLPPVTPPAAQPAVAATADPAARPAEMTPGERRDQLHRVADLLLAERFKDALAEVERLPQAEDRQAGYQQAIAKHELRRTEVEARVRAATTLADAQAAVRPAVDGVWGMPGDREWGLGLLHDAQARLAPNPDPPPTTTPTIQQPATEAAPPTSQASTGQATLAIDASLAVLSALAKGELAAAQAAADGSPADQPEGRALRLAVAAYPRRIDLLDRIGRAKSVRLRMVHPVTRETMDVTAASANSIEMTSTSGGTSSLPWSQIGSRDIGRLLGDAATAPGTAFDDHACAITGLIIGGDAVLAAVHARKVRTQLTPEQAADLDALVAVGRRSETLILLARAVEARKAGAIKGLGECIAELRKPERIAVPEVAAALPELDAALQNLKDGKPAVTLADRITFDAVTDLAQFPESSGVWQVAAGSAGNSDTARLARQDMASARSVQIVFTPNALRGQVTVEFKGLKLVFDLAAGQFTTQIADTTSPAKPCTIIERVPNLLYLAYSEEGNHTSIELNSQVIADQIMGDLADRFAMTVSGGAMTQIDEVVFTRADTANPAREAVRRLGWDPTGNALVDEHAGTIVLDGAAGPAGISCQVPPNTVGFTIEVQGQSTLRIQLTTKANAPFYDLPLNPLATQRVTVRWAAGTFAVLDGQGVSLYSVALTKPVTTVAFIAKASASILLPIRPNRQ